MKVPIIVPVKIQLLIVSIAAAGLLGAAAPVDAVATERARLAAQDATTGLDVDALMAAATRRDDSGEFVKLSREELEASFGKVTGPCVSTDTVMCLRDGRFLLSVDWSDGANSGEGMVVPHGTDETGIFWFFGPDNWELLVKVLNGCSQNGYYWVFAAASTNVQFTLTVLDLIQIEVKEYASTLGEASPSVTDLAAFDTCP